MGRGAAFDGNGRQVFPPAALSPVRLYRQPPPPRRTGLELVARILLWLLAAVVMLAVALLGGVYLFFHESVAAVRAHTPDTTIAQKQLRVALPGQAAIALVVGYDHRAGADSGLQSRSDTVMLLRADPQTKTISMLSFPRDLVVDVRCPDKPSFRGRINTAYATCGSSGTLATVKSLTGLPVNYLITVNFHGFKQIVDRLGGVWIDVDRRYFNNNAGLGPGFTYATINLLPGYQRVSGSGALDFVRYRHTDSDLYRVARQQAFVKALKEQIAHAFAPTALPKIIGAITHNVEVGVGGGKALSGKTVLSYALFAYELPAGHFFQTRLNGLTGYSELRTDPANVEAAVQDFVAPDVEAPRVATAVALGKKVRAKAPPPASVSAIVLNGNGVTGSASNAAYLLGRRGYRIVVPANGAPANAPRFDYFHTKVYFDPAVKGSRLAGKQLANVFGAADVERMPPEIAPLSNRAMLVVVVGQTFHNTLAPVPADRTPKRQPAAVVFDRAATEALVTQAQRKVPFKLEVPTVIEKGSSLDRELPLRVYTVEGEHKAVRLVFRTGASEYWGVEETDWTDAPVLSGPNFRHALGGREFYLYYSGPHLHMVVLRANGATYWVVNTLLDSLSNETMLAIAKGLKPLGE